MQRTITKLRAETGRLMAETMVAPFIAGSVTMAVCIGLVLVCVMAFGR